MAVVGVVLGKRRSAAAPEATLATTYGLAVPQNNPSFSLPNPGLAPGQVAAILVSSTAANMAFSTAPPNFTQAIRGQVPTQGVYLIAGYIVAGASDPASYSFTIAGTFSGTDPGPRAALVPLSGVNAASPLDVAANSAAATFVTAHPGASLTTVTPNAVIIRAFSPGTAYFEASSTTVGANGGTEVARVTPQNHELVVTKTTKVTAGALPATTFTTSTSVRSVNIVMAFKLA